MYVIGHTIFEDIMFDVSSIKEKDETFLEVDILYDNKVKLL